MASASRSPISGSLFALIAPTWAICSLVETFFEIDSSWAMAASTALRMPRWTAIGLLPATMFRVPSRRMARASTVAVVVPSPASDEVLSATSWDQFRSHVLERVFQFHFLADGHAVLGNVRAAERFVDDHIATGRAHGDGDRIGQFIHAAEQLAPSGIVEHKLFWHR